MGLSLAKPMIYVFLAIAGVVVIPFLFIGLDMMRRRAGSGWRSGG